jgi:excinuclease UvrABC nuclease subunit
MRISQLIPTIEVKQEFEYSKQNRIPNEYGCYVITNFTLGIMYIGKATSLLQRFINHLENIEKNRQTQLGRAYWFCYTKCKNEFEIAKMERGWLNQFQLEEGELPVFNKIRA